MGCMTGTERAEGLRERKKRETRQRISDIATGLFLERGFNAVTIAEIAEVANVSVNTVYNYFPAKEDLFFDREAEVIDRPSKLVRERAPGESAARAILGALRRDIVERNPYVGLTSGYERFMQVVQECPALMARLWRMQQQTADQLADTLREETGAGDSDPLPELVATQIIEINNTVFRSIGRGIAMGGKPDDVAEAVLRKVNVFESILSDTVLNYASRPKPLWLSVVRATESSKDARDV